MSMRRIRWSHAATLGVVAGSILGAMTTHSLGFVNILNGALQVSTLIALAPSAVGYFLLGRESLTWRCTMTTLLCTGLVASCLGFVYTTNDVDGLTKNCMW